MKRTAAIDPKNEKEMLEKKMPKQEFFETKMKTMRSDGKVHISFSLENISGEDQKIQYGSGQSYDIWVYNDLDEEVYRWSYNKVFTQALIETELKKSGLLEFVEVWNMQDNQGTPVPPGTYTFAVKVMIGLQSGTISQDELTASSIIELR
ncbi:BsuPI-related putative proteinase inhibitor [Paenibacillus tarimensis]